MDTIYEVLKWVILILLAGFIGQFGKSMSQHVIDFLKKRKGKGVTQPPPGREGTPLATVEAEGKREVSMNAPPPSEGKDAQAQQKAEKKLLKTQLKAKKKLGK